MAKNRKSGSSMVKTKAGHKVRSKSEAKIDDWLFSQRMNYVYEPVFWMNGRKIEPDWVIMPGDNPAVSRPIIIEYWGLSYSPKQMKRISSGVENAQEGYAKRRKNKEAFYAELETYDYIGIIPDQVSVLKRWLPEQFQKLGIQVQIPDSKPSQCLDGTADESVSSLIQVEAGSPQTQSIQDRLPAGWRYIPKQKQTHA